MQKLNAYPSISLQISVIVLLSFVSFLTCIPRHIQAQTNLTTTTVNETYKFVTQRGSEGTDNGEFNKPSGIAIDSHNNVYVADSQNGRVQKFDSNGNFITQWGSSGTGKGQFDDPKGIAVDLSDNVYVVDSGNNRIEVFAPINENQTSNSGSNYTNNSGNTISGKHAGISDQF